MCNKTGCGGVVKSYKFAYACVLRHSLEGGKGNQGEEAGLRAKGERESDFSWSAGLFWLKFVTLMSTEVT